MSCLLSNILWHEQEVKEGGKEGEAAEHQNRAIWRDFSELGANNVQLRAGVTFAAPSVNRCKTWNTSRLICFHVRLVHLSHLNSTVF
jgi:hypothetical protein